MFYLFSRNEFLRSIYPSTEAGAENSGWRFAVVGYALVQVYLTHAHVLHALQWRHNESHDVWNNQQLDGVFNYLFKLIKENIKVHVTGPMGIHRWPVDSPHKGPVTRNTWRHNWLVLYVPIAR